MFDEDPQIVDVDMVDAMGGEMSEVVFRPPAKVVDVRGRGAGVVAEVEWLEVDVDHHLQVAGGLGSPVLRSEFPSTSMPVPGSGFQHSLQHLDGIKH